MSRSKAVAQEQMRSKGGRRLRPRSLSIYLLIGGLGLGIAVGLSVYFSQSRQSSPTAGSLSSSAPLSVAAIGKLAPGFSLPNQYGQTYTLTPVDNKNHVLVFYMGNF